MDIAATDKLIRAYEEHFSALPSDYVVARAPGRIELAGNHTDHQGGRVIAGAIANSVYLLAAPQAARRIDVWMEGYGSAEIDLAEAGWDQPYNREKGTSAALVRGMASQLADAGANVRGCRMVVTSDLPVGSGLSSSAAFEMAAGAAMQALFCNDCGVWTSPVQLALAGVASEQMFFGKPCGAQDQIASALGGIVAMDFSSYPPRAETVDFDLNGCGWLPCYLDCRCDHSLYGDEFARIPADMHAVAEELGKQRLGDVAKDLFLLEMPHLRDKLGDMPVLRALHYFAEDERVGKQVEALRACDMPTFLKLARQSGSSSAQFLQNVTPKEDIRHQPAMVMLALCADFLGEDGAYRIHGGGFGGGAIAFVAKEQAIDFESHMQRCLGYNPCLWVEANQPGAHVQCFQQEK